jgi:D-hexose-6-phosphate mutarotase
MEVDKTRGKARQSNVVNITASVEAEIRSQIQQQIEEIRSVDSPKSVEETLHNYFDVLEENVIYLAELEQENLHPVIDSQIEMAANLKRWLKLFSRD